MNRATRAAFVAMLREEWRLHRRLFGGRRFAAFPLFVALLAAGGARLLVATGTDPATLLAGAHALAFAFGVHTGSLGLVGRDALRDLLGDATLLVFAARSLPLTDRRLVAVFLAKDAVYYAVLFLLPVAVGVPLGAGLAAATVPALWLTGSLTFVLGAGATAAVLGATGRRRSVAAAAVVLLAGAAAAGVDVLAYTPYGLFRDPTPASVAGTLALVGGTLAVGALTLDPGARRERGAVRPAFRRWCRRTGDPLAARALLRVARSAGGVGKPLFSAAVLLGVAAALVDLAGQVTGVPPSSGVTFGAVLGLTGFTTYNWLSGGDVVDEARFHPLGTRDVFRAQFRAFLLLGPAVGLAAFAVAVAWTGATTGDALAGAVLLVGVAAYVFGVTVALAGLSPNEFLFDTALFAAFGAAVAVPLVPLLVVGLVVPTGPAVLGGVGATGVVLALLGVALFRRSLPRWERHHR